MDDREKLRNAARAQGLGAAAAAVAAGFGCCSPSDVDRWIEKGYPRLALAVALGVPFAPYVLNVKGVFGSAAVTNIPNTGSDVKLSQDVIIDDMMTRIVIARPPANMFQTMSDFFFNFQSGIEATLDVMGTPRYAVAPRFTPLSTLTDIVRAHCKLGWALTYRQQLEMAFNAPFALPEFPVNVCVTFQGKIPQSEEFVGMTNYTAVQLLRSRCGIDIPDSCGSTSIR